MARLSATTALLLLSLLAVAHCRVLEAEPVSDEQGPTKPAATDEAFTTEAVVPVHRFAAGQGFLRLPSHRRHRHPCRHGHALLHRNPWWARHHGFLLEDAYRFHRHGGGVPHLVENRAHLVVDVPAELPHVEEPKDALKEDKAVAEPDPDRSHPDLIKEQENKKQLHGEEEEEDESVKAWKREMWRRFRHGRRFHHRRHHHEDDHEQDEEGASGAMKRFHHHEDEDEEEMTRKRFHHDGEDNDALESDEEEEVARRWRKAIMRRRFHHHHRHHHHAEETDEQQEEEGGVMKWFKDLMNRF